MFKITIEGESFENFQDNVAQAAETICGAHRITGDVHTVLTKDQMEDAKKEQSKEVVKDEPKKKTTKKSTSTKKAVQETKENNVEVKGEPEVESEAPASELSYESDVKPIALKLAQKKGREAFLAVLDSFGVKTAQNLKPEQYGAFIDAVKEELE